jgi:hypothetical protein
VAEKNPAWFNFLQGSTGRSGKVEPGYLGYNLPSRSSGLEPIDIVSAAPVTGLDARLQQNPDLEKQVNRLEQDRVQAAIVGADIERPKGILGWFQNTAAEAFDNPVARTVFQAISVFNAGRNQLVNAVANANEDINPLNWLADRMDEFSYGRIRTDAEREQAIEGRLEKLPGQFVTGFAGELLPQETQKKIDERSRATAQGFAKFAVENLGIDPTPKKAEDLSLDNFISDVKGMRGSGELLEEIKLTEDAGTLEKAWKLPLAFVFDMQSAFGARGPLRFGSNALSRSQLGAVLGNQADDSFRKYATRAADETEDAFNDRATLFATRVNAGQLNQRSRGVRQVYIDEFGEKAGKEAFDSIPKELKGGLGVGVFDARIGNLNAGGETVDAVARALGIDPKVFGTKWNPAVGYQSMKNNLRTTKAGRVLNNFGIESTAWGNWVNAVVKNKSDADLVDKYSQFMTKAARDPAGRLAELYDEDSLVVKAWLQDYNHMSTNSKALYDRVNEIIDDPMVISGKTELDELDRMAVNQSIEYRAIYDGIYARFLDAGLPVSYLNNFTPVLFDSAAIKKDGLGSFRNILVDKDGKSIAEKVGFSPATADDVTKPGLVNLPGKPYDPTKDRSIFITQITDVDGTVRTRAATTKEMRDTLLDAGMDPQYIKYIKTNPGEMLADYADRAIKAIAAKRLVNELRQAKVAFRGNIPVLNASYDNFARVIDTLNPKQLQELTTEFLRDENSFTQYMKQVNDQLAKAYDSGDKTLILAADKQVKSTITAMERLGDVWVEKVMSPEKLAKYRGLLEDYNEALDIGDADTAAQIRVSIDREKRNAMTLREEGPRARKSTIADNVERKQFEEYMDTVLGVTGRSATELKRLYNLSDLGPLTADDIKGVGRIPDEFEGLIATESLRETLGKWLQYNARYELDEVTSAKIVKTLNAATQGFRTGATFGGGPGFVGRNGIGATFTNIIALDADILSYKDTQRVWWTRFTTDLALKPLEELTGSKADDYLARLITDGKLGEEAAALAKAEIIKLGKVSNDTVAKIRKQSIIDRLAKLKADGYDGNLDAVYEQGVIDGVYDPYQSIAAYAGLKRDPNAASLLNSDVDWISIRNDRKPIRQERVSIPLPGGAKISVKKPTFIVKREEDESAGAAFIRGAKAAFTPTEQDPRSIFQRGTEAWLNAGFDVKANGRTFNFRGVQLVRDMNGHMEEYQRGAALSAGLRKYGTDAAGRKNAGIMMKAAQFDYSNLTEAERLIGRLSYPFYTWLRYNLPLQIRLLVQQPGTFNTVIDGWDTVKGIFGDPNGDVYFMPEYAQEAFAFMINPELQDKLDPIITALGGDPENPLALRLESPILDLNKFILQGDGVIPVSPDVTELASGMNPFAKALIQVAANKNLYTGRTYSKEGVEAPKWYQAISTITSPFIPAMEPEWDVEDQVYKVNERWLDAIKTVLPTATTNDRTTLPMLEIALKSAGYDVNLSNEDEKLFTSILSKGLAAPVTTVTPQTEAGEVASRYRYAEDQILTTTRRQRMSQERVEEYVRNARKAGMLEADIIRRGRALAESGFFS